MYFESSHEARYIRLNGIGIYLSHYALRTWRNSHHGSMHLHGHSHGSLPRWGRSRDVGFVTEDANLAPINWELIYEQLIQYEFTNHHPDPGVVPADPNFSTTRTA
jgi:calcineurin-like phosphoesterase family protein